MPKNPVSALADGLAVVAAAIEKQAALRAKPKTCQEILCDALRAEPRSPAYHDFKHQLDDYIMQENTPADENPGRARKSRHDYARDVLMALIYDEKVTQLAGKNPKAHTGLVDAALWRMSRDDQKKMELPGTKFADDASECQINQGLMPEIAIYRLPRDFFYLRYHTLFTNLANADCAIGHPATSREARHEIAAHFNRCADLVGSDELAQGLKEFARTINRGPCYNF